MKKGFIIAIIVGIALVVVGVAVGVGVALSDSSSSTPVGPNGEPIEPNVRQPLPPVAGAGRLLLMYNSQTRPAGGNRIVARSYDQQPWELVSDLDFPPAELDCTSSPGECGVLAPGETYIEELSVPASLTTPSAAERFVRLGLQATFGFNRAELMATSAQYAGNVAQWVRDQMAVPATLLRTYFRERTSPRQAANSWVGTVTRHCDVGARYHRFAFNNNDLKTQLDVTVNDAGVNAYVLRINGVLRGEVTTFLGKEYPDMTGLSNAYTICTIGEGVDERVQISATLGDCASANLENWVNPAIAMTTPENTQTLSKAQGTFKGVPGKSDAFILTALNVACVSQGAGVDAFFRYDGTFLRFDPRLKLISNTLEEPANVQASATNGVCPAVPRTFLNVGTCVRRESCAPQEYSSAPVVLNDDTLRAWYTLSGRYVYYMRGLALTSPYDISPCDNSKNSGISRWLKLNNGNCASPTNLDATTRTTIATALADSEDTNTLIRDITLTGDDCTQSAASIGAKVTADNACWQHVHNNEYDVRDMTYWVLFHDGNDDAADAGKPNPISRWAISGLTHLDFPVHNHPMTRWRDRQSRLPFLGRYGDTVDFRSLTTDLQTEEMADRVGATIQQGASGTFEACGAPGEAANNPELGHRFLFQEPRDIDVQRAELDWLHESNYGKQIIWMNVALTAADQLRQRTAWAISQILTISFMGIGNENLISPWVSYYDIFVRHAFGNYLDILKEVSYHPMMGDYLSYRYNRAYAAAKTYPDENYAREIMQLFSIGLWQLNDDGTRILDETGEPIATYTNDDIVDFARVWTGFDRQRQRGNIEARDGIAGANRQDPMQIVVNNHDWMPKAKLDAGYLGDHHPLCYELPPQHWVRKGAVWKFTGAASIEGSTMDAEGPTGSGPKGRFEPSPLTSALYQKLCAPVNNRCTFPSEVVLDQNLLCDGQECAAGSVISAKIVDAAAGVTNYYTYESVPCVRLTYAKETESIRHGSWKQCTNKRDALGSILCCETERNRIATYINSTQCTFANEKVDYDTAKARCEAEGYRLCPASYSVSANWDTACSDDAFFWYQDGNCTLKVQVLASGLVELVDPDNTRYDILKETSGSSFRVRWQDGFPVAATGCGASCTEVATAGGPSCLCDVQVTETVVYSDPSVLATPEEIQAALAVGAPDPTSFDAGVYTQCTTGACAGRTDVKVWTKAGSVGWGRDTIFELEPFRAGGRRRFLFNYESRVHVDSHSFRNPPHWMPLAGEQLNTYRTWHSTNLWLYRAHQEVDDLLEHLFEHQSTAPFVAYRMIQRMVTSNPSPRYMKAVVDAFRTGTYKGEVFSGKYGDMGATVMAVLMDPEARNLVVEADPSHGQLREPLLKLIHVMRVFEFKTKDTREVMMPRIFNHLGQEPLSAPSVFGFYLPEHRPAGPVSEAGLVSPEAEIATAPLVVNYLNGMSSLIDNGLTACDRGFGWNYQRSCSGNNKYTTADGKFEYTVDNTTSPYMIVQDMNLLLTGGRLDPLTRDRLVEEYEREREENGHDSAVKRVMKLLIVAPEFHTTNSNVKTTVKREPVPETPSQGRPYKAIVVIFESGGSDSFNKIVPHSGCGAKDLYAEYASVRTGAAIAKSQLLTVPVNGQPCSTFGINPETPVLKQLYDDDQAAFLMNIGVLVEPMTKEQYNKRLKKFPPSLYAHNTMQRSIHNVHAQNAASKGVLGRIVTAMEGWKSELYSLTGNIKILEGTRAPDIIDRSNGVIKFTQYGDLKEAINNFTEFQSRSYFSETYTDLMQLSLDKAEAIGSLLSETEVNATFLTDGISRQLTQIAKLIKLRKELKTERAVFVANQGGFDTHSTFDLPFGTIDGAMGPFVEELKLQGVWDDVVIITISDFARTLTSNGAGTDHAWGGMHWVAGGSVRGGQTFGTYPDTLTEDGDLNLGRGRVLPTMSFEAPWRAIAEWFGVPASEMATVLPNMANFDNTISANQMFR